MLPVRAEYFQDGLVSCESNGKLLARFSTDLWLNILVSFDLGYWISNRKALYPVFPHATTLMDINSIQTLSRATIRAPFSRCPARAKLSRARKLQHKCMSDKQRDDSPSRFLYNFRQDEKRLESGNFLLLSIILCFHGECDGNGNNHYDDKGGDDK